MGCKKCRIVKMCSSKSVIGDWKPEKANKKFRIASP